MGHSRLPNSHAPNSILESDVAIVRRHEHRTGRCCQLCCETNHSILTTRKTITKGHHDPCVGVHAVPVGEAVMACVLLDHVLLHHGQVGENRGEIG